MRLSRSIERLALFVLAPPVGSARIEPEPAAQGAGTVIGGSVDPSRSGTTAGIDLTTDDTSDRTAALTADNTAELIADLTADLPVAPATRDETPLDCEVHLQFGDRWIDGFQIEETIRTGSTVQFRLRRQVDGWVLPELFDECEVRVFTRPVVDAG